MLAYILLGGAVGYGAATFLPLGWPKAARLLVMACAYALVVIAGKAVGLP